MDRYLAAVVGATGGRPYASVSSEIRVHSFSATGKLVILDHMVPPSNTRDFNESLPYSPLPQRAK
jgi:hypothetical protein